eukprot:1194184-Rhodomonas_salina.1
MDGRKVGWRDGGMGRARKRGREARGWSRAEQDLGADAELPAALRLGLLLLARATLLGLARLLLLSPPLQLRVHVLCLPDLQDRLRHHLPVRSPSPPTTSCQLGLGRRVCVSKERPPSSFRAAFCPPALSAHEHANSEREKRQGVPGRVGAGGLGGVRRPCSTRRRQRGGWGPTGAALRPPARPPPPAAAPPASPNGPLSSQRRDEREGRRGVDLLDHALAVGLLALGAAHRGHLVDSAPIHRVVE